MPQRMEVDAKEVLDKYIVLIGETEGRRPQDESKLPASKSVIKEVLLHVLKIAPHGVNVESLKMAYLELANFQDQKAAAKDSIDGWLTRMDESTNASSSDDELRAAARTTVSVRDFLDSVERQVEAERAVLADELVEAGFEVLA